jgi:hypothetical protein
VRLIELPIVLGRVKLGARLAGARRDTEELLIIRRLPTINGSGQRIARIIARKLWLFVLAFYKNP